VGKIGRIINVNDTLYEVLGTMSVESSEIKGTEYWKKQWGADNVLRNGNVYYYCRTIIDAEFEDI
jgi:YHS domain-containing protein